MKYLLVILFIFILKADLNLKKLLENEVILIGEYHYFTKNDSIQYKIINDIIKDNRFKNYDILLEYPPELEYYISRNDTAGIRKYFIYNKDSRFIANEMSSYNKLRFAFVSKLFALKNTNISVKCIDTHYTIRPIYYTILYIINKYKVFPECFSNDISNIIEIKNISQSDINTYDSLKGYFLSNKKIIKSNIEEFDYKSLETIFNTPLYNFQNYKSLDRDKYMFNRVKDCYSSDKQIIAILGNAHIKDNSSKNLYRLLSRKYNVLNKKKVSTISIVITKNDSISLSKFYDYMIVNSNGEYIFKNCN